MKLKRRVCFCPVLLGAAILSPMVMRTSAQTTGGTPRITQAVDEKKLVVLQGNVHPLTHGALDLGFVSDAQPLTRMLLLLKRSPEQESALLRLLDEQQTKSSTNYHKWLIPEQVGQQFGPAEGDIQGVTDWLKSQGFQDVQATKGRTIIEFSGNVGQVRNAFHTQIRRYSVNGEERTANATIPQIPAAFEPVVAGIVSLHNFPPPSHVQYVGNFYRSRVTGEVRPLFTPFGTSTFFPLAPADFAKIYNVTPLWGAKPPIDGSGQTIAIIGESNIHVQDIVDFQKLFGLPQNFTSKNVILNGPDPGINRSEGESDLDIEWSLAVAPRAKIAFVTSAPTETTSGVHLSALYVVDNNLAGVMSESFGQCEQDLGAAGNQFYQSLWQQATAQGITVILSAGDGGTAGCDNFNTQKTAKRGLAVSGFASTPFNVAVGGTDFDQVNRWTQYWNLTNDPVTQSSVKSYIPEIPWNDSCAQLGIDGCGGSAPPGSLNIIAGSGGASTVYAKPAWQSGAGVPNDNKRDVPDVSLFASDGFTGSVYIMCQADAVTPPNPSCNLDNLGFTFQGAGGTSASAPAFAGIMALVNQKQATSQNPAPRQGNANYVLYALARKQSAASLNCNSSAGPDAGCTFNDITKGNSALAHSAMGNNSVPCSGGSLHCSSGSSGANGVLVDPANKANPAWTTNAGYDLVTGLGSVNAQNLVNNWNAVTFLPSTTTLNASVNGQSVSSISGLVHGQTISVMSTVAAGPGASGTPAGQVALMASPNPATGSPSASRGIDVLTLANGTATGTNVVLPGGTYALTGHYQGDGSFGPSDSAPTIPVNISAENSKTLISIPVFDATSGKETGNTPSSVVYGSPYIARIDVGNAQARLSFPPQPSCNPPSCPTGTITLTDALSGGAPTALDGGTFALNSAGFAEDLVIQLPGGSHQLSASYSGDSSYKASASAYPLIVTPATTTTGDGNPPLPPTIVTPFGLSAIVRSQSTGVTPSCNVTFFEASTPVPGTVTCSGQPGGPTWGAFLQPSLTVPQTTSGIHTYIAKFNGDANYAASTSAPMTTRVFYGTSMTLNSNPSDVQYGSTITLSAIVNTSLTQGLAIPQAVSFNSGAGAVSGTVTYAAIKDGSGNLAMQATVTLTPQYSTYYSATFAGDTNYSSSGSPTVFVNVNIPGFSVASSPTNLSVTAGRSGAATITVTPVSNATSPVTLSCLSATLPAGATCSFSPSNVTLSNGKTAAATLTVSTLPPSANSTVSLAPLTFFSFFRNSWELSVAAGLVALILQIRPRRSRRYRLVGIGLAGACVLGLFIGCGGGSGAGVGSGGGGPVPTSMSLTTSGTKVPNTAPPTFQAKVSSSRMVTGSVTFLDQGATVGVVNVLADGTASLQSVALTVGTHVITASYSGDTNNLASKTNGSLNQVITGTVPVVINGTTGGLTNQTSVMVTIQ